MKKYTASHSSYYGIDYVTEIFVISKREIPADIICPVTVTAQASFHITPTTAWSQKDKLGLSQQPKTTQKVRSFQLTVP